MSNKQQTFFNLFERWMWQNGYSYQSAAARLNCKEKHIAWVMNRQKMPTNRVVKLWLPTLLEGYDGNVLAIYKLFD